MVNVQIHNHCMSYVEWQNKCELGYEKKSWPILTAYASICRGSNLVLYRDSSSFVCMGGGIFSVSRASRITPTLREILWTGVVWHRMGSSGGLLCTRL
jgi:hypothetical protein